MICKKCGTYNTDDKNYCTNCGESLNVSSQPYQPTDYSGSGNYNNSGSYNSFNSYGQNTNPTPEQDPGKGLAIAAMICGIVSFLCFWYITGPLGIIFGAIAKNKGSKSGMATAGIICGAIGVALGIITAIFLNDVMGDLMSYASYY